MAEVNAPQSQQPIALGEHKTLDENGDEINSIDLEAYEVYSSKKVENTVKIDNLSQADKETVQNKYGDMLENVINSKQQEFLYNEFLNRIVKSENQDMLKVIIDELSEEQQALFYKLSTAEPPPFDPPPIEYDQFKELYAAIHTSLKEHRHDDNRYHLAYKSIDKFNMFMKIPIRDFANSMESAVTLEETKHYKKRHKKSIFLMILETILPFLKSEPMDIISITSTTLGSVEKATTEIIAKQGFELYATESKNYMQEFDEQVQFRQEEKSGNKWRLDQDNSLRKSHTADVTVEETVSKVAKAAGWNIASGIKNTILDNLQQYSGGYILNGDYSADKDITNQPLSSQIHHELDLANKRAVFECLSQYAQDMHTLYMKTETIKAEHPELEFSNEVIGFARMDNPEFNTFMVQLSQSLGYEDNDFSTIENLVNASEEEKNQAFSRFFEAPVYKKNVGLSACAHIIHDERARTLKQPAKDTVNYFYILDLQAEMLDQISKSQYVDHGVKAVLENLDLGDYAYNPESNSYLSNITGQMKVQIVNTVKTEINDLLKLPTHTSTTASNTLQAWLTSVEIQANAKLEDTDLTSPQTQQTFEKNGLLADEIRDRWNKAQTLDDELFEENDVQEIVNIALEGMMTDWKQNAISTMVAVSEMQGSEFCEAMLDMLVKDVENAEKNNVNKEVIQKKYDSMELLHACFDPETNALDTDTLNKISYVDLKSIFDALHLGYNEVSNLNPPQTPEDKARQYMIGQALSRVSYTYHISDLGKTAFNEVYMSNMHAFKKIPSLKISNMMTKAVSEKIGQNLTDYIIGPNAQFNYYAKEKSQQRHNLSERSQITTEAPPAQSWTNWTIDKTTQATGYLQTTYNLGYNAVASTYNISSTVMNQQVTDLLYEVVPVCCEFSIFDDDDDEYYPRIASAGSLKDTIIKNSQIYIREQTFDCVADTIPNLYELLQMQKSAKQQGLDLDNEIFKELGFGEPENLEKFLNDLANNLGFEDTLEADTGNVVKGLEHLMRLKDNIASCDAEITDLKEQLSGMYFFQDKSQINNNLEFAEKQKSQLEQQYNRIKNNVTKLPQTDEEKQNDKFVGLKAVVKRENHRLNRLARKDKLENSTNYVVMVSSLNDVIFKAQLTQRGSFLANILPDIEEYLYDENREEGLKTYLKEASVEEAKVRCSEITQQAIMQYMAGSIDLTDSLSQGMKEACENKVDAKSAHHSKQQNTKETIIQKVNIDAPSKSLTFSYEASNPNASEQPAQSQAKLESQKDEPKAKKNKL